MKKKITNFLTYNFFFIIGSFFIAWAVFSLINNRIYEIKDNEKIDIFIESPTCLDSSYIEDFDSKMKEKHSDIYETNFYYYSGKDSNVSDYYEKYGKISDIIILSKTGLDVLKENDLLKEYFLIIDSDMNSKINNDSSLEIYKDKEEKYIYGYTTYSLSNSEYNSKFSLDKKFKLEVESDYILLINYNSKNFSLKERSGYTSYGFDAIDVLMEIGK